MTCQPGIYKITNTVNGKVYVGSAVNLRRRFTQHRHSLRKDKHHSIKLQRSWNKHGENRFIFSVIEHVTEKEKLIDREQFWMDKLDVFNVGYNTEPMAGNSLGVKHSEEARKNMSLAHIGKKQSPEMIAKRVAKLVGRKDSLETRQKKSNAMRGIKKSKDFCLQMSIARKGIKLSPEHRKKIADHQKSIIGIKRSEEFSNKLKTSWKSRYFRLNADDVGRKKSA